MKHLIGISSAILWGFSFAFMKQLLEFLTPAEIVFYRHGLSGIFFGILILLSKRKFKIIKEDMVQFLMISFLGIVLYQVLICQALTFVSTSFTAVLNGTIPLITLLGERIFRKKKITTTASIALAISLTGIGIMTLFDSKGASAPIIGTLLILIALTSWVSFTFLSEKLFSRYTEIEVLCYQSLIGAFMMLPLILRNSSDLQRQLTYLSHKEIVLNMLVLSLGVSALGYLCYMYGLKHLGVSYMSFVMNLLPGFAMFGAYIILREVIRITDWIGVVLIVSSVIIVKKDIDTKNIKPSTAEIT